MKRLKCFRSYGDSATLHKLRHGRVAVLKHDPTEKVNFTGEVDEDYKYD